MQIIEDKACIFDVITPEICNKLIQVAEGYKGWQKTRFGKPIIHLNDKFYSGDGPDAADMILVRDVPILINILGDAINRIMGIASYLSGKLITKIHEDSRLIRSVANVAAMDHIDGNETLLSYRRMTGLIYLSDYKSHKLIGGDTTLQCLPDGEYCPKQGRIIVFRSDLIHGGKPVIAGTKYLFDIFMGTENDKIDG